VTIIVVLLLVVVVVLVLVNVYPPSIFAYLWLVGNKINGFDYFSTFKMVIFPRLVLILIFFNNHQKHMSFA
jgi:hypothetical protein